MAFNTVTTHAPSDPYSRYSVEADENDIGVILKVFSDHKLTIFGFALAFVLFALAYVSQLSVTYTATAKGMLQSVNSYGRADNILQSILTTGKLDVADLLSQIQIMQSPPVLENLVIDQRLYRDPEFGGATDYDSYNDVPPPRQRAIVARVKSAVKINPVIGTSIVEVSAETTDRVKSAAIANSLIRVYGENEEFTAQQQVREATQWLADRLKVLREDVREAEMALEEVREENNLTLSQSSDSRLTKIELLTTELTMAEAKYAETIAMLQAIEEARSRKEKFTTIPKFLSEPLIENLKITEAALLRRKAILERRYGPNHPEMIAFKAELAAFQEKLNTEIENFMNALKNEADIQSKKIDEIENRIATYRTSYQGDSERRMRIKNLQTQADTARQLLNSFMASYLESLQSLNIDKMPVRMIAQAMPPSRSNVPNKLLIILLSGVTGLFMGMFISLILERVQDTVQTPRQIERLFGLPVYVTLPFIKLGRQGGQAATYILDHPASVLSELTRTLFTTLQLRNPHRKSGGRVVTITSTHTGEGKTTNALWLATAAAQAGKKVIIVDADMRRPSLHKECNIGNAKGLVDYLSDRLPLDDTIYTKHASGVHMLTSKAIPTHALTLLNSDRMENTIRRLRDIYDMVIIDVPTCLVFSDASVMARLSDQTLYVVEWKKTKRDELKTGVKQFTDMDYQEIAFILNKVNDKRLINIADKDMAYIAQL